MMRSSSTIRIWAGGIHVLLYTYCVPKRMLMVNVVPPPRVRISVPPVAGHHADELQPEGPCVAKIDAFWEADTGVTYTQMTSSAAARSVM